MDLKKVAFLVGAAVLALAPTIALADPRWGGYEGYHHQEWRRPDDRRQQEWREHERWERRDYHRGYWYGYADAPIYYERCYTQYRLFVITHPPVGF